MKATTDFHRSPLLYSPYEAPSRHWGRYEDKYPKATACPARDRGELLAFDDFPGVRWTHLRTTNVI